VSDEATLLLTANGIIQYASATASQWWQVDPGALHGDSFSNLFVFDVVSSDPEWLETQWLALLDTGTTPTGVTLAAQPKAHTALIARAVERIYRREARRYLAGDRPGVPCAALQTTVHLSSRGEVYPCSIWDKPLGNIRDHGYRLQPIIEAARQVGVRRTIACGGCPNCWTPCEAYPSILASPLRSLRSLLAR
jgi:hypothetical protein